MPLFRDGGCNGFSCVSTCVRFTRAGKTYHLYHGAESAGEKSFAQITAIYDALNKTGIHHDKSETILTKRPQGSGRAVEGGLGILNLKKQDQEESYAAKKKSGESAVNLSDVLAKAAKNKEKEKDQYIYEEVQDVVTEIMPFKVVTRYV
ncbi:unnamed protein product [Bursaphelenchus xylophilus]|uniref:(pine wood nematode) hypothetical protein n=1 Tax=Bursaphelenchus xylophilus TaxID=6326 RepID=A0A7I8WGR8_BURXY|nr:unnamed protein product [Bursaphelenchus xylophilus]CAG9110912.1 unnamed protein product [Bursaphelenchus xylophilus]